MRNEDDEIQILGSAETPLKKDSGKNRRVWIAAWTAVFILACVCLFFFLPSQQASVADQQQPETSSLAAQEGLETEQSEPGIHISSDLVNDVPLTIIPCINSRLIYKSTCPIPPIILSFWPFRRLMSEKTTRKLWGILLFKVKNSALESAKPDIAVSFKVKLRSASRPTTRKKKNAFPNKVLSSGNTA